MTSLAGIVPDGKFDLFVADFSDLAQVKKMGSEISYKYPVLDVLINNAAIYSDERKMSADNLEMTFQINYLSHFLLTRLLLDNIKKAEQGRIINVSSMVHQSARLSLNNLQGEEYYDGYNAYSCSKLENILFTLSLADELEGNKVTVNALHPGVIRTKLLHAAMGGSSLGSSVKEGAATSVYLASAPEVENVTGKYFVNGRQSNPSRNALDKNLQKKIREISEVLTQ
jgi:NAD(P)-dependent dehydrogenase (short-subunit alcohol dehydrogenase family)